MCSRNASMDKLQPTGWNLGRVFNFRSGHLNDAGLWCYWVKLPSLKLKTRPIQLQGSIVLPVASCHVISSAPRLSIENYLTDSTFCRLNVFVDTTVDFTPSLFSECACICWPSVDVIKLYLSLTGEKERKREREKERTREREKGRKGEREKERKNRLTCSLTADAFCLACFSCSFFFSASAVLASSEALISANLVLRSFGLMASQSCHHIQVLPIMKLRMVLWTQ